jgi:general secretion pathway protein L
VAEKTVVIDLSAPARLSDLPAMTRAFLGWWGGELASLLPQSLFGSAKARTRTRLLAGREAWRLEPPGLDARSLVVDPTADDHAIAEQIMREGGAFELAGLEVLLPSAEALIRRVELPAMADRNLHDALELQIDRLSPFTTNTARIAYRRVGRDFEAGKIAVDVAIVPNICIEPLEQRLQALGLKPGSIDIESPNGGASGFDLRKPPSADERRRSRILNLSLALLAAVIWVLALNAWGNAAESERASWNARIAELRPVAERSAAIRRRIEALIEPIAIANAHDPARMLNVLDQLTRTLPNDTRVLDFKLDGTSVEIAGLTSNAPDLIGKLEAAPAFKDVKFTSPVVRRAETTQDRFEIAMQLDGIAP